MADAVLEYRCRKCDRSLFDAPNCWHALSQKHVFLARGSNTVKNPQVLVDEEAFPGSKSLQGCTVRALRCGSCMRSFGLKVITSSPDNALFTGKWIVKRSQIGCFSGDGEVELLITDQSPRTTHSPLPVLAKSIEQSRRSESLKASEQAQECLPLQTDGTEAAAILGEIRNLMGQQTDLLRKHGDALTQLTAKMDVIFDQVALLKEQMASLEGRRPEPSSNVSWTAISSYHSANELGNPVTAVRHFDPRSSRPSTGVPSPTSSHHKMKKAPLGDVEMSNTAVASQANLLRRAAPIAAMEMVSTGARKVAVPQDSQGSSIIRPSTETQDYLERNIPHYDATDGDFEPSYVSQVSVTPSEPTAEAVAASVERLMTPARPLVVNKNSLLNKSPVRNSKGGRTHSFDPFILRNSINLEPSSSRSGPFQTTGEQATHRNQTIRRRGVSGAAASIHGLARSKVKMPEPQRDAQGILMTPSGRRDGRSLRWKSKAQDGRRPASSNGQAPLPAGAFGLGDADARPPGHHTSGTSHLNHTKVMAKIRKGQRSDFAQSRLMQGYQPSAS